MFSVSLFECMDLQLERVTIKKQNILKLDLILLDIYLTLTSLAFWVLHMQLVLL